MQLIDGSVMNLAAPFSAAITFRLCCRRHWITWQRPFITLAGCRPT